VCFLSKSSCRPELAGVKGSCELQELRRGLDDSTGLRSATKLNTPRTRCESRLSGPVGSAPLLTRRSKTKKGAPTMPGPFFLLFERFDPKSGCGQVRRADTGSRRSLILERGCCGLNDGDALCGDAAHGDANCALSDYEWLRDSWLEPRKYLARRS
jgi:hypothetical protein